LSPAAANVSYASNEPPPLLNVDVKSDEWYYRHISTSPYHVTLSSTSEMEKRYDDLAMSSHENTGRVKGYHVATTMAHFDEDADLDEEEDDVKWEELAIENGNEDSPQMSQEGKEEGLMVDDDQKDAVTNLDATTNAKQEKPLKKGKKVPSALFLRSKIKSALKRYKYPEETLKYLIASVELGYTLPPSLLVDCIRLFARHGDLRNAFNGLRNFDRVHPTTDDDGADEETRRHKLVAYRILCDAVGETDMNKSYVKDVVEYLHRSLSRSNPDMTCTARRPYLQKAEDEEKVEFSHQTKMAQVCLPRLLLALCKPNVRRDSLSRLAVQVFDDVYRNHHIFPFDPYLYLGILELNFSPGRRPSEFLPYHFILRRLVEHGTYPSSSIAIKILQREYPYVDTMRTTNSIIQSFITLYQLASQPPQQQEEFETEHSNQNHKPMNDVLRADYLTNRIDLGLMEQLCNAGASRGSTQVVLMLWDLSDLLGYTPTEGMYEAAIMAFLNSSKKQDESALAVFNEMEKSGYTPSGALIRSMAGCIGISPGRIDNTFYMLTNYGSAERLGLNISTSSLNCVIAACSKQGFVDRAFSTFTNFPNYNQQEGGIQPNLNTFEFLLEVLATKACLLTGQTPRNDFDKFQKWKNKASPQVSDTLRAKDSYSMEALLESAEMLLSIMEQAAMEKDCHCLHQYVSVLAYAGKLDQAMELLTTYLKSNKLALEGNGQGFILMDTFCVLTNQCMFHGDLDRAKKVTKMILTAGFKSIPPILTRDIRSYQQQARFENMKNQQRLSSQEDGNDSSSKANQDE